MERSLTHIALFAALIAILGLVPKIDLAAGVPITAQSLGVMLCGTVLGARRGALAVVLFLVLVAAGLPLLSGGRGGLGVFASPSVGFLLGFPVAAFVAGWVMERTTLQPGLAATAGAVIGGIGVLYVFGILGMALILQKSLTEASYLAFAFLPGDAVKAVLAGMVTQSLARMRPASLLSRA
ncbi:MAG: biotin transporter BioY [Tabrizicola sp.]|uniref:biotin transporter BioY n=1 Tax=Tabrizicola sp. TaxID=2005166 RepID=UPI0027325C55|nr:biotin transporter BioY [Tabrizicola sp.]MDP3263643.1 biotin transporter BioY [Tabrizicola sp.]MDP3647007.1 biotin transporter BioY [Paracoccaceae bacterium]MDZ4069851.1 biotin transporter BioY [Tabrizicola sp.]